MGQSTSSCSVAPSSTAATTTTSAASTKCQLHPSPPPATAPRKKRKPSHLPPATAAAADHTLSLPDECLATVFSKLGCHDRNSCSLVSKRWSSVDSASRHRLVLLSPAEISPSLPSLLSRFTSLTVLSLKCSRKSPSIDNDSFAQISRFLNSLQKIKLKGCTHISDDGLVAFSANRPSKLSKVSFASCGFGAKGINSMLTNCSIKDLTLKRLRKLDTRTSHLEYPDSSVGAGKLLVRLCVKDLHNAGVFTPLLSSCSKSLKTLIVCRSSGNWDGVLEESFGGGGGITSVMEIQFESVQLGDQGLTSISTSCPDLQALYLSRTTDCTDDGLSAIAGKCKKLRKLHIDAWTRFGIRTIGDDGVLSIAQKSSHLQEIVLMGVPISVQTLNALASNCRSLERMALCNTDTLGDAELAFVAAKFLPLKKLCIKNCPVSELGIAAVGAGCPNLVKLKVKRCRGISAASIGRLKLRRRLLVVSVDEDTPMAFDSGAEEEERQRGAERRRGRDGNPNHHGLLPGNASGTTANAICTSMSALFLKSKFENALHLGRGRRGERRHDSSISNDDIIFQ
ncbi:unnamed protein product [Linum tenue]|uniref:F-box domain-containing protein n=3 Tax=Linum tenue TaxID=586396 RepID=A0AAV0S644_9ROSI|nr:unnamed protein product [Linum tenue]